MNVRHSSTNLKRQSSGDIPSLTIPKRPLGNLTNFVGRSILSKRKIDEISEDPIEYNVPTSNYASINKFNSIKRTKSTTTDKSRLKLSTNNDDSLRLVTSTIQGMKHWSKKRFSSPILFEVFGQLDSQVTNISSTNSRQFSLIDERDRIECIFAEIDQRFSHVDRDVQLRIICRLDSTSDVARCVSIRVAHRDEWNERNAQIKLCDFQLNDEDLQMKKQKKN